MRRFGTRPGRRWTREDWHVYWQEYGPKPPTEEQLLRRNEIQAFRLVLAKKEPQL